MLAAWMCSTQKRFLPDVRPTSPSIAIRCHCAFTEAPSTPSLLHCISRAFLLTGRYRVLNMNMKKNLLLELH